MKNSLLFIGLLLVITYANAHDVRIKVENTSATLLSLSYDDNSPVAFEAYELYADANKIPSQVGRTSSSGQVAFLPGNETDWHLKVKSVSGHDLETMLHLKASERIAQVKNLNWNGSDFTYGLVTGLLISLMSVIGFTAWQRFRC